MFEMNLQYAHQIRIDELQDISLTNIGARSKNRENFRSAAHGDHKKIRSPIIAISVYRLSLAYNAQDTAHTYTRERVSKKCHGMQWKSRRRGRAVNNTRFWQTSPRARFYVLFRTRVLTENLISRPLQTTRAAIYEMFARNPTGAHFVDISAAERSDCNSAVKSSSSRQLRFLTFARLSNFSSILNSV